MTRLEYVMENDLNRGLTEEQIIEQYCPEDLGIPGPSHKKCQQQCEDCWDYKYEEECED